MFRQSKFKLFCGKILLRLIKSQLDKEFNLNEFMTGAKKAVVKVSNKLATKKYDLAGLVTKNVTIDIEHHLTVMPKHIRKNIAISPNTILEESISDVDVQFDFNKGRFRVEIEACFCAKVVTSKLYTDLVDGKNSEYLTPFDTYNLAYYRFRRYYAEGLNESQWIISGINHMILMIH